MTALFDLIQHKKDIHQKPNNIDSKIAGEVVVGMRNDSSRVYIFLSVYLPPV